jgi:hypothetical protein
MDRASLGRVSRVLRGRVGVRDDRQRPAADYRKNRLWIAIPGQRQLDRGGTPKPDINGKLVFKQNVEFRDRATSDGFSREIVEFVRAQYPEVENASVSDDALDHLLAAHFRYERANTAAGRFISRSVDAVLPRSAVLGFVRNRRNLLSPDEFERCADEAIERWLRSRANRYRPRHDPT